MTKEQEEKIIFEIISEKSPLSKKYFNLINTKDITKSYKWHSEKPSRQTYSPYIWIDFFDILLNQNKSAKPVEKLLNEKDNLFNFISSGNKTRDKGWYGSTLARLFYIPDMKFRQIDSLISRQDINDHINIVCNEWKKSMYINKNLLTLINDWFENYQITTNQRIQTWEEISDYEVFVKNIINTDKLKEIFSLKNTEIRDTISNQGYKGPTSINTGINETYFETNKQISDIAKNIVENVLGKKYGVNFVTKINKFDLCDFIVKNNDKKIYVEVKSSTNNKHFFISRSELEFKRDKNSEYHIYFVYNINVQKNSFGEFLIPDIKPILNFNYNFELNNKPYNKDSLFHLMPVKFKGKIPS